MPTRISLLELLKEEDYSADKHQRNLSEFVAEQKDIQEALNARWAVRNIWKVLVKAGRITMPYSTFCRHVRTLSKTPKEGLAGTPHNSTSRQRDGFTHNPTPDPGALI